MLARIGMAVMIVAALLSGCTDKLSFASASMDEPGFAVSPETGGKDTKFRFDAAWASGHNVTWDFGDGTVAHGATVDHAFGFTNGLVTVTLIVTDETGKQAIVTRTLTLGSGVNAPPRVSVYAPKTWVEVATAVEVTARASDADKDPLTYLWTYRALTGGGAEVVIPGSGAVNNPTFDAPGKYAVKVRARDPKGAEAVNEQTIDVSKRIPSSIFELRANGTLVAGTGGHAQLSEQAWVLPPPAPDTSVDAARHAYTLLYPGSTVVILMWNDTSTQGVWDLDLELRNADTNKTIFKSEHRAPAPAFEFNFTQQEPGNYVVIIRSIAGAKIDYGILVRSSLRLTPELVAATEK